MSKWTSICIALLAIAVAHVVLIATALAEEPAVPSTRPVTTGVIINGSTLRLSGTVDGEEPVTAGRQLVLNFNTNFVKATYLGVEATEADETLRAQLKLPAGVGLAVRHVDEQGPAKTAGLQQHDVLYKLNDQLLINTQQFAVLVRTFKPDDKIELTVIREAQPVKLTATLVQKEVEALSANTESVTGTTSAGVLTLTNRSEAPVTSSPGSSLNISSKKTNP